MKKDKAKIVSYLFTAILATLLLSCGGGGDQYADSGETGSLAVALVWPGSDQPAAIPATLAKASGMTSLLPTGVATVRFRVSGPGMNEMVSDFAASLGHGEISGVPTGSERTLTIQGLDVSGSVNYQGTSTGITVTKGQKYDCGAITMVSQTPTTNGTTSNFDTGTLEGWGTRDNSGLSTTYAHSGTYSIKMNDTNSTGDLAECYNIFSPLKQGTIEFWSYIPSGNPDGVQFALTDQDTWNKYYNGRFVLWVSSTGAVKYYHNNAYSNFPTPATISLNTWNKFLITWNSDTNEFQLSINGTNYGTGYESLSGGAIQQLIFHSASWSGVGNYAYFDDVVISQSEVSASSIFSPNTIIATNQSAATVCAENDNINIPFTGNVSSFSIESKHPTYSIESDICTADFTNCSNSGTTYPFTAATYILYDDHVTVVTAVRLASWWRPTGMSFSVDTGTQYSDIHYIAVSQKITDENSWPQFLVLYMDGNMRLIPQPPAGVNSVCFGSSVIIGPTVEGIRPLAEIDSAHYDSGSKTITVTYKAGSSAVLSIGEVNRDHARVNVSGSYLSDSIPFAVLRSMYVADGNADVDHVQWIDSLNSSHDDPVMDFISGESSDWLFHRQTSSQHNTSSPDIKITTH